MRTSSSPKSSRSVRSATCAMPCGSQAPLPSSSFADGTPKRMTPPMPTRNQLLDLFAQRVDRVLKLAGNDRDLTRLAQPFGDEEWRDEVIRGERRLGDEAAEVLVCVEERRGRSVGNTSPA